MDISTNNERCGHVIEWARGMDGESIGHTHVNPFFDTHEYEVEFTDGTHSKYQANVIAENMFVQVDEEGNQYLLLKEIMDHKCDNSTVSISNDMIWTSSGTLKPKVTTHGWSLHVSWHDGSTSWEPLKNHKASNPVEVAEYAVANWLVEEPALNGGHHMFSNVATELSPRLSLATRRPHTSLEFDSPSLLKRL